MKKKLLIMLVCFPLGLFAQDASVLRQKIDAFARRTGSHVSEHPALGNTNFIRFGKSGYGNLRGSSPVEKSLHFLQTNADIFGIKSANDEFLHSETRKDGIGFQRVTMSQHHKGVPVFDGNLFFQYNKSGELTSVNGNFIPFIKVSPTPTLSQQKAESIALQHVDGDTKLYIARKQPYVHTSKLYIFHNGIAKRQHGNAYLAYEVEIRDGAYIREFVFVNAHSGEIIEQWTGIHGALNRLLYETSVAPANLRWSEGNAFPGTLDQWQQNEVQAAGHSYYFFKNAFNWVSYDNADHSMTTVNNDPGISCPNANWNGTTANYCTGTAADDVVAHEWGHAYTEYTCDLIYQYQSGALNESLSDVWGETIDLLNGYEDSGENNSVRTGTGCSETNRWKMGEDASAFGGAIRDMWVPTCNSNPGKVTDTQYACGTADAGGVHTNSGVTNHCYALLVDGGTYNGQTITGIGFTKAAHIFWRAQSNYLNKTSDFPAFADALEAAGNDLLGVNLQGLSTTSTPAGPSGQIITASDLTQLSKAILAVQLRTNPTSCPPTPMLSSAPALCSAATSGGSIFFEDWETGMDGWTVSNVGSNPSTWTTRNWILEADLPEARTGTGVFGTDPSYGDCTTDLENGVIRLQSPIVNIPTGATGPFLMAFNHYVSMEDTWDGGNIKYSRNGGAWTLLPSAAFTTNAYNKTLDNTADNNNPLKGQTAFTGADANSVSGTWGQSQVSFAGIGLVAGDNIQLRWEVGTDGCNGWDGWYLDEIRIYTCTAISNGFTITQTNSPQSVCQPNNATFNFTTATSGGFSGNISLSASGNPTGTTVMFSPNPVAAGSPFTMTVSGTGAAPIGSSNITVTGTSGAITDNEGVTLNISGSTVGATTLTAPANAATNVSTAPTFSWTATSGAATYDLQVATDVAFTNIVVNQTGLAGTSFNATGLSTSTTYRWRVRGVSPCATGAWSSTFSFTTITPPPCSDIMLNGGYESDAANWTEYSEQAEELIGPWTSGGVSTARTGTFHAWLGYVNDEVSLVYQSVTIPANATSATLTYYRRIISDETGCSWDFGGVATVDVVANTYTPRQTVGLCTTNATSGYVMQTYDMMSFVGQTINIGFYATTDSSIPSDFLVDDVKLDICVPAPPTCPDDLTINENPIATDSYEADLTITSAGVVPSGNTVSFESQLITLQAGFHAQAGCDFHAFIGQCPTSFSTPSSSTAVAAPSQARERIFTPSSAVDLRVMPNPFSGVSTIEYEVPTDGVVSIFLTDMSGRRLTTLTNGQQHSAGQYRTSISSNGLAKGLYLLHLRTASGSTTKKIIIMD